MKTARYIIKTLFFVAFIVAGFGFTKAFVMLLAKPWAEWQSGNGLWLSAGFVIYIPLHIIFRRLIVLHVFGHELTHALWSMLFGGKIHEIYVSRNRGGFATYTKGNFLVTLAPYFFPLYAVFFLILHLIVANSFKPYIDILLGASISFHVFLTIYSLRIGQQDLKRAGVVFSLVFIYMMNCVVLGLIISTATGSDSISFLKYGFSAFPELFRYINEIKGPLFERLNPVKQY
ncbi:MAG TPA: M50 family metallopeptidase [bacterium]|nr:M50 family metallopeptidase [bacterium]